MPYDPQVGPYSRVRLPSWERRIRRRPLKANLFVRGPVPLGLLVRCIQAHPMATVVLLRLRIEADTLGLPVTAGAALARSLGLDPQAWRRALVALERGDLITVERAKGRAPRVWFDPALFGVPR